MALNYSDLTDGLIASPITMTEFGTPFTGTFRFPWSATLSSGAPFYTPPSAAADRTCADWTQGVVEFPNGLNGILDSIVSTWSFISDANAFECFAELPLICVEQ